MLKNQTWRTLFRLFIFHQNEGACVQGQKSNKNALKYLLSRSGKFIIRVSGSDKQMLCAALNIAAEKVNKRGRSVTRRKNLFLWGSFSQKGELHAALKSLNSFLT